MHENDRPTVPGELNGARRISKREPGDVQPFPGRDVGEAPADRPGERRPKKEPLTDQPAVEGP